MKKVNKLSIIRVLMIGVLFITVGRVNAIPYTFSVDQIMLLGNVPGFVEDEFDDGVIAPWEIDHPTAIESGGVVTLSHPGDSESAQFGNYLVTRETSQIRLTDNLGVEDGAGDFLVASRWLQVVPAQNQVFDMRTHLESTLDEDLDAINIGMFNAGPLLAELAGLPTGLNVFFAEDDSEDATPTNTQFFPITAEDIMGDILFSLYFDDSTDLFTGGFSLNGGVTFQHPFTPIHLQMSEVEFDGWELNANAYDVRSVPETSTFLLLATGLISLGLAGREKIKVKTP
jgi:hypothetical protein